MRYLRQTTAAGLSLAALVGLCAGAGVFAFDYAEGTSYLSNDPTACVNCHIMRDQYDGWLKGGHHTAATCNDCHTPVDFFGKYWTKVEHGFRHSKGFTFQDFHEPIAMKDSSRRVVEANCVRCHGGFVADITACREPGDSSCITCHRGAGHGARH